VEALIWRRALKFGLKTNPPEEKGGAAKRKPMTAKTRAARSCKLRVKTGCNSSIKQLLASDFFLPGFATSVPAATGFWNRRHPSRIGGLKNVKRRASISRQPRLRSWRKRALVCRAHATSA
jgi:hypothetical protein